MKILIVDDDKLMLEVLSHYLEAEGYGILVAEDGFQALEIIQKEKIDLIISDIMMPNISGLGLLNLLKQFYFNNIPIILISSLDKKDFILRTLGLGAIDFITKPIDFKNLSRLVKKYLKEISL
jgi:DNA-binding response OmpR family regulator